MMEAFRRARLVVGVPEHGWSQYYYFSAVSVNCGNVAFHKSVDGLWNFPISYKLSYKDYFVNICPRGQNGVPLALPFRTRMEQPFSWRNHELQPVQWVSGSDVLCGRLCKQFSTGANLSTGGRLALSVDTLGHQKGRCAVGI